MINLGVTRKDMGDGYYGCAPCCESDPAKKSDWEKEVVNPELRLTGKHAELFGLDDLRDGDEIKVTLLMRVIGTRNNTRTIGDKTTRDLGLDFKILESSDMTDAAPAKKPTKKESESKEYASPVDVLLKK